MVRGYTHFESNILAAVQDRTKLSYSIDTSAIDPYEDWVLHGITFFDANNKGADTTDTSVKLLKVYAYQFKEGFHSFILEATLNAATSEIQIRFVHVPQDPNEKSPDFADNTGDMYVINVLSSFKEEFKGQNYVKSVKDVYRLMEVLGWKPEYDQINKERTKYKYQKTSSLWGTIKLVGGGGLGLLILAAVAYKIIKGNKVEQIRK